MPLDHDLFVHGDSVPANAPRSLTAFSEQLVALMDELRVERCAAVGLSLGAMIDRRLAIDHPHRRSALERWFTPEFRTERPEVMGLVERPALFTAPLIAFLSEVLR